MTKFVCQRCGKCCGIVPFNKKEYNAVRKIAQQRHIGFTKQEMGDEYVYFPKAAYRQFNNAIENIKILKRDIDNQIDRIVCPFLEYDKDGKSRCTIYELRPEICRMFGKGGHPYLTCPNNRFVEINLIVEE